MRGRSSSALAVAVVALVSIALSSPAHAAEEIEPSASYGYNDGEAGYHAVMVDIGIPTSGGEVTSRITGGCAFTTTGIPNTNRTQLSVVGHATSTASGAVYPVATGVACRVENLYGGLTVDTAAPATTVAEPGTTQVVYGALTVCVRVFVYYNVNFLASSREICRTP